MVEEEATARLPRSGQARALIVLLLLSACGGDTHPLFVGSVQAGQVFAAGVWSDGEVLVYTCGREGALPSTTAWMTGDAQEDMVELGRRSIAVTLTRAGDELSGEWGNGTATDALRLQRSAPEDGALFLRETESCRTAAIALRDAEGQLQLQGAHVCGDGALFSQVTPVRPLTALSDALLVAIDGGERVELARFR